MSDSSGYPIRPERRGPRPGLESPLWHPKTNRGEDDEPRMKPPFVEGHRLGGRGMATVEEIVGQITEANVMLGDALGGLAQAQEEMEAAAAQLSQAKNTFGNALGRAVEARDMVAQTVQNSGSATLNDMLGLVQSAIDDHLTPGGVRLEGSAEPVHATMYDREEASTDLSAAMEKGETYIGMALG